MFDFWHEGTAAGVLLVIMNIKSTFFQIATQHHSQALYSRMYCRHLKLTCESWVLAFLSIPTHVHWLHTGNFKSAIVGIFAPGKLVDSTNLGSQFLS